MIINDDYSEKENIQDDKVNSSDQKNVEKNNIRF